MNHGAAAVDEIEAALVGHWSHFGRWPRGALVEESGTLRYETPIVQLPYNGVIRTRILDDPDMAIERVLGSFAARQVCCLWWCHPTASPPDLGDRLATHGLRLVEEAIGMSIDLRRRPLTKPIPPGVHYVEVLTHEAIGNYSELIFDYWEVPQASRALVEEVNRYWAPTVRKCTVGLPTTRK